MCLGIPGQVTEFSNKNEHLAKVDVSGVTRIINIGLLEDEHLEIGDWVLIHVGFAMSKIDEEEAALALASLQLMGQAYDDELEAFWSSRIETESVASGSAAGQSAASERRS
ncbi:MAG TPA: HypC/HybG/HupF family hydrogenase formation chaperone [Acidimicrobiales bacterium]|jgi:hydrogenase expression/formation protein HypC